MLLTNLVNDALPLIRYELTDEVTPIDEPCPCGSQHRRIADIEGRLDDGFAYGAVAAHPHVFRSALGRRREIVEYQVRQTPTGAAIAVVVRGELDREPLRAELAAALGRLGLRDAEVRVDRVDALPRQASGKLARFVPLRLG